MSPRANVRSVDSVRGFRPALVRFEGDFAASITSLRTELNRTLQWLDHDCPAYWQQQVRMGFDKVAEARTQLARKQMITVAGHRADCIDEKKALAKAKRDLEIAQQKVQVVRQWSIKAHRAADEYNSQLGNIEQSVVHGVPTMMAMLDRIVTALEGYVTVGRSSETIPGMGGTETDAADAEPTKTGAAESGASNNGDPNAGALNSDTPNNGVPHNGQSNGQRPAAPPGETDLGTSESSTSAGSAS